MWKNKSYMNKRRISVVRLILRILRITVVIGFVLFLLMILKNEQGFGSIPLGDALLAFSIIALIMFIALLIPELIIRKRLRMLETNRETSEQNKKHIGLKATLAVIGIIVAAFLFIWFGQDYLLFIPQHGDGLEQLLEENPECRRVVYGSDSDTYVGWLWTPSGSDEFVVVYFGGNAQCSLYTIHAWSIDNEEDLFGGHKVLYIDYPGYGENSGKPGEKSIFRMVDTIMPQIISEYEKVYVMGFSVGTGPATYAAANYDIEALVLNAPYDNMTNVYNDNLNIFHGPFKELVHNRFTSDEYAHSVTEPVLIIASEDDEVISFGHSRRLSECFENAEFFALKNVGHNEILGQSETKEAIKKFLSDGIVDNN